MESDFTDILNKEGFFFQKWCAQKIQEANWTIEAEEYPISENESFDIKAVKVLYETALHTAVIECKRQDPTRKYWMFYSRDAVKKDGEQPHFLIQTHNLSTIEGSRFSKGAIARGVFEGLNESKLNFPLCHTIGVEIFKNQPNKYETNPQVVFNACLTVAKGINHLFNSEAERLQNNLKYGLKQLQNEKIKHGWPYFLGGSLIPVVITSASLFSIAFDSNAMDTKTFNVLQDGTEYAEKEWLVYEFPLPKELRYESKTTYTIVGENRYAKMHIFVVNGKYVAKFFNCLGESLETRHDKSYRTLQSEFMDFYTPKRKP